MHIRLARKPGLLPFRKVPRSLADFRDHRCRRRPGIIREQLAIADKRKWLNVVPHAAVKNPADLFLPARRQHRIHPMLDSSVERRARRLEPNFNRRKSLQRRAARRVELVHRFPRQHAQLDRPNYFLRIARRNARSRTRIEPTQQAMQILRASAGGTLAQTRAKHLGARRRISQPFEQRTQIQSSSGSHNRQTPPRMNVAKHFFRPPPVISRSKHLVRLDQIHHPVRYPFLLSARNFPSANIKAPVNLRGIANHHLAAKLFSKRNRQRRFPASRRPKNHRKTRRQAHCCHFQ